MTKESFNAIKGMLLAADALRNDAQVYGCELLLAEFIDAQAHQLMSGDGLYDNCDEPGAARTAEGIATAYMERREAMREARGQ
jgi:hypothetical protein